MVQKWAIGAMINMTGSVAINLGTNLMKLSHKLEKGELPPATMGIKGTRRHNTYEGLPAAGPIPTSPANGSRVVPTTAPIAGSGSSSTSNENERAASGTAFGGRERSESSHNGNNHGIRSPKEQANSASILPPALPNFHPSQINPSQHCRASEVELTSYAPSSIAPTELSPSTGSCSYDDVPLTLTSSVRPGRSGGGVGVGSDSVSSRDEGLAPSRVGSRVSVEVDEHNNDEEARLEMLLNEEYGQPSGPVAAEAVAAVIAIDVSNLGEGKKQARELLISEEGEEEDNGGDSRGQGWQEEAGGGGEERLFSAPPGERRLFRRRIKACWWCGAALLVVGSLVNFASFGFAPQSLLASLGSVQFVSNVAFGKVILHEVVTRRIVVGTATIILGNTLTLCFSPHQDENYNILQLKAFYNVTYNSLLALELAVALIMHVTYKQLKRRKEQGKSMRYSHLAMPLAYAICSAIIGTQSVIQAKCLSELITMTLQGDNQMGFPFTYLVIVLWLGTTVFWLVRMNRALAMFHGLFIIPALQVFWTFFSVIGGGFYFREFKSLETLGAIGFAFGVLVVFLGVYLLAPRTAVEHGQRVLGRDKGFRDRDRSVEDAEGLLEEGEADLRKMLKMEGDISPVFPRRTPIIAQTRSTSSSACGVRCRRESSLEAGDEEIDWNHTRMLSLGFFPSISTDQDVGYLTNPMEGLEHDRVIQRLSRWDGDRLETMGADNGVVARVSGVSGDAEGIENQGHPSSPRVAHAS